MYNFYNTRIPLPNNNPTNLTQAPTPTTVIDVALAANQWFQRNFNVRAARSFRASIDFRGQVRNDAGANAFSSGNFTFDNTFTQATDNDAIPAASIGHSWAAFQLGIPTTSSIDNNTSRSRNNPYFGWYGMDTWRLRHDINITAGLRMEYEKGPSERNCPLPASTF